jgi:hypothetical protein
MKNIHLLPTPKPSRLQLSETGKFYLIDEIGHYGTSKSNHIYITNSEEIKEGFIGWFICPHGLKKCVGTIVINNEVYLLDYLGNTDRGIWCSKIILTTDQDLINDGVQPIDDEFLEWFVKNPSCEEVVTERVVVYDDNNNGSGEIFHSNRKFAYEIIIPQEEPKQETLEEAAERYIDSHHMLDSNSCNGFIEGAKWKEERSYSEEEVFRLTLDALGLGMRIRQDQLFGHTQKSGKELHEEWFDEHKKK